MDFRDKILSTIEELDMGGRKAAEIMGMSYDTFRHKKRGSAGYEFTEKNLEDFNAWMIMFCRRFISL